MNPEPLPLCPLRCGEEMEAVIGIFEDDDEYLYKRRALDCPNCGLIIAAGKDLSRTIAAVNQLHERMTNEP